MARTEGPNFFGRLGWIPGNTNALEALRRQSPKRNEDPRGEPGVAPRTMPKRRGPQTAKRFAGHRDMDRPNTAKN